VCVCVCMCVCSCVIHGDYLFMLEHVLVDLEVCVCVSMPVCLFVYVSVC